PGRSSEGCVAFLESILPPCASVSADAGLEFAEVLHGPVRHHVGPERPIEWSHGISEVQGNVKVEGPAAVLKNGASMEESFGLVDACALGELQVLKPRDTSNQRTK